MQTQSHLAPQPLGIAGTGTLLLTEADLALMDKVQRGLPGLDLQAIRGVLDLKQVREPQEVTALWITVRSKVGHEEIEALPNLKLIVTASAGYDHIDLEAAKARCITVCNVPEYGPAVAEFNIALMLALSRKLHRGYLRTLQDEFALEGLLGRNLHGKTLGVVGAGTIGMKVLELAKVFGMTLLAHDPYPNGIAADRIGFEYTSLERLIASSDIIALCCPLNESTRHMIDRSMFEKMKKGVLIVNTSRGAVIDTQALLWALNHGIVDGAALDVLEAETALTHEALLKSLEHGPPGETAQTIAEDLTLMRHPRVLVTPHMAYYSRDSLDSIEAMTIRNVEAWHRGRPTNTVT